MCNNTCSFSSSSCLLVFYQSINKVYLYSIFQQFKVLYHKVIENTNNGESISHFIYYGSKETPTRWVFNLDVKELGVPAVFHFSGSLFLLMIDRLLVGFRPVPCLTQRFDFLIILFSLFKLSIVTKVPSRNDSGVKSQLLRFPAVPDFLRELPGRK